MKKIIPFILIATSSLVLSGCTKKKPESQTQTPPQIIAEANEFTKAIESGSPTICTITKDQDLMEYHIKGKKMRLNSTTTITNEAGKSTTTIGHMINDGQYIYTWDETTKQGAKMAVPTEEETKQAMENVNSNSTEKTDEVTTDTIPNSQILKNEGYTISCKAGSVEDSSFIAPSDVTFVDPKTLMMTLPSPDANGKISPKQMEELKTQFAPPTLEDQ